MQPIHTCSYGHHSLLTRAKMYVIRNTKRSKNQEDFKMWVRSSKWRTLALHPLNIFILHSSPESQGNILCSCVHHITRIVWKVPRLSLNTLVHLHVTRTNSKCYTPYGGGGEFTAALNPWSVWFIKGFMPFNMAIVLILCESDNSWLQLLSWVNPHCRCNWSNEQRLLV